MLLHPHAQLCEWRRKTLIPGVVSSGWWLLLLRQVELFSTPWTAATGPSSGYQPRLLSLP